VVLHELGTGPNMPIRLDVVGNTIFPRTRVRLAGAEIPDVKTGMVEFLKHYLVAFVRQQATVEPYSGHDHQ
jgi:hypothetical protein